MGTADFTDPHQPKAQYDWRVKIEGRHRILKCFHDLSDFSSRSFNVIALKTNRANAGAFCRFFG
jgi:hypothetical protein